MKRNHKWARDLEGTVKLEGHWDKKLAVMRPITPRDLEQRGLVTYDNYKKETGNATVFCTQVMVREFEGIGEKISLEEDSFIIEVLGPGVNIHTRWIGTAISEFNFNIRARDISGVAVKNISNLFSQYVEERRVEVIYGEIEETLETKKIKQKKTIAYFASQFFSVLSESKMKRVLGHLGVMMDHWPKGIPVKPRLYLVHPLPEDNRGPKMWNGIRLPGVVWGDTTPYSIDDMLLAVEQRLNGRKALKKFLGKFKFFHQKWAVVRITLEP